MGGDNFPLGKIFQEFLGGRKISPPPLFSEFWCFPSGFWCQNSNWGGKYAQNSKWGEKKRGGTDPWMGGGQIFQNFFEGGKTHFSPLSLTLVHVCMGPKLTKNIFTLVLELQHRDTNLLLTISPPSEVKSTYVVIKTSTKVSMLSRQGRHYLKQK